MRTDMIICQVFIFIFGASAVWLVGRTEHWKRWGYISGLCGGPFWLYMAAVDNQWGVFALSLWYSYSWGQGVWNYWIKPWRNKHNGLTKNKEDVYLGGIPKSRPFL